MNGNKLLVAFSIFRWMQVRWFVESEPDKVIEVHMIRAERKIKTKVPATLKQYLHLCSVNEIGKIEREYFLLYVLDIYSL